MAPGFGLNEIEDRVPPEVEYYCPEFFGSNQGAP